VEFEPRPGVVRHKTSKPFQPFGAQVESSVELVESGPPKAWRVANVVKKSRRDQDWSLGRREDTSDIASARRDPANMGPSLA
jgi:hypothetical protein